MAEIAKRYLTLTEFCRLTGLSASTVRRRVRDGSIPCLQPGGRKRILLFEGDALNRMTGVGNVTRAVTAPATIEGNVAHSPEIVTSATTPTTTDRRGPVPKWKRDLAALQT